MDPRARKYYEQGWQYGREARNGAKSNALMLRQSLSKALGLPEAIAVARVAEDYERRLDTLPPLAQYSELRGMRECVEAFNRGIAEGSEVPLTDVILRANFLNVMCHARRISEPSERLQAVGEPGCTLVYFPHSERGPLVANNNDGVESYRHHQDPEWIVHNRAGIILGTVSSGIFDDEVSPQQFPAPVFLMVQELCGTTSEAVDLLTRLNLFWGPCNTLVADRHGDSAIIEKSACRYGLRKSANGFSATTEMSAEEPGFGGYLWETRERSLQTRGMDHGGADWAYWKTCERRSARLQHLVAQASAEPTFSKIEQIIYDHTGKPEQIHMDGSRCHPDQEAGEWSLRTTIWVLNENRAFSSFAEPPVSSHLTPRREKIYPPIEFVF